MSPERFFSPVDGLADPCALIGEDMVWSDRSRLWMPAETRQAVQNRRLRLADAIGNIGWMNWRKLSSCFSAGRTYEDELLLCNGTMDLLLAKLAGLLEKEKISVLDYGCGQGLALRQLGEIDVVDEYSGVTLPIDNVLQDVRDRICRTDAINIRPNLGERGRFDVVISVYGVAHYSSLNRKPFIPNENYLDLAFGILQTINFLNVGGFLLFNMLDQDSTIKNMISMGILSQVAVHDNALGSGPPMIYRLNRRPTESDVRTLLNLPEDGAYRIVEPAYVPLSSTCWKVRDVVNFN